MAYENYIPGEPLRAFVRSFWYWEGAPQTPAIERLMPTGEPGIIVNLRDDALRTYSSDDLTRSQTYGLALFSGARTQPFVIHNQQQERVFGIQFRYGGGFPFVRPPACELENESAPLDALWRGAAAELRERLLTAKDPAAMFKAAESVMLAQTARPLLLHPAVNFALQCFDRAPHNSVIANVTNRIGLSQRRFIELFREQVGLTPKAFCRVRRFQYVLRSIHEAAEVDWSQVALESGYYDQAHFIHDFRDFSSLTPRQYWLNRAPHLNHVPVRES
jgi:AraC-like DNA-binding protein